MTSIDTTIAAAILGHLASQIGAGPTARAFVRLESFSEATYRDFLSVLDAQGRRVAGRMIVVRSIAPIAGQAAVAMEPERSATWYRNNLPTNQVLVLILNRRTSDAQSLKDLYAISEQTLTRDGLGELIAASFAQGYQLDASQQRTLTDFVHRLRRLRLEPQLRDLAEFLRDVEQTMRQRPGTALADAIADALPCLNLFRCREFAAHLNTPRGDKLIRTLKEAAQLGTAVLDERARLEHLGRLERSTLADDQAFGGLSAAAKIELLHRFIDGLLGDNRRDLLQVFSIDWSEVRQIIVARERASKPERYLSLGARLASAAEETGLAGNDDLDEVLGSLSKGREPDGEAVERLLSEHGDTLGKALRNDLRRTVRPRTRQCADFLVGLTGLAVDLLQPRQETLERGTHLRVSVASAVFEQPAQTQEAASVFRAIYGGLEQIFTSVEWQLEPLWALAATTSEPGQQDESVLREQATKTAITFRVAVIDAGEQVLATADLIWQYRADSPAAATAQMLAAEHAHLHAQDLESDSATSAPRLRVPIFNSCQALDEIGDLDLRHPLGSLGPWYAAGRPGDLRAALDSQFKPLARQHNWAPLDQALGALEGAWAEFVLATAQGLLGAKVEPLLLAYEDLLATALGRLQSGNEVSASYRLINQAWMIGPPSFATWAIMPLLHPLKLLWWRERARYFDQLLARLLDDARPAAIIDLKRFQQELAATYGSSGFPPVLALPPGDGRPAARFLPVEEAEGYELYFHEAASNEAFGLDPDLLAEDENELAALRAVEGLVAVVQDYIETYPFVRDGVELFLFECRNGALPGMLIEQLLRVGQRRGWSLRLTVVVHTSQRGAPLFRRVSKWVASSQPETERQGQAYFPPVSVKVLECAPDAISSQHDDTDIVVLADVLAERGQQVGSQLEQPDADVPARGYLPTYRARQEPFQHGEQYRRVMLSAPQQPSLVRRFLLAQHAALTRRAPPPADEARFYRDLTLDEWKSEIERLHGRFNWVVCYDTSIDRFLLEAAFPDKVQVIRYSLGLGAKRQHNLTVSSSGRAQAIVIRRLARRLEQMFPRASDTFCTAVAGRLVDEAKRVSGDIVLRAAGPGAFLNELIGLVAAKFETEQRHRAQHPDMLSTWILLDDFEHWFGGGKFPDLLFVGIGRGAAGQLVLHLQVLEAKCVGELSFDGEASDAQIQVRQGVSRLVGAFAPGNQHLDALYWYDQLYRAVAGNLAVDPEQQELWELFRDHLHEGAFQFDLSGHAWVFCYDGQAQVAGKPAERLFLPQTRDRPEVSLRAHHYGRNELAGVLQALINARGGPEALPDVWNQPPNDEQPLHSEAASQAPAPPPPPNPEQRPQPEPQAIGQPPAAQESSNRSALSAATPEPSGIDAAEQQWLESMARELERALRLRSIQTFRINPGDADVGPSIVRFKLRLHPSESIKKIQSIAEDLARDLALSSTPIIDNVLRTNFVGVDIPREHSQLIELGPLLARLGTPGIAELPIIVGLGPDGKLLVDDLSTFPHLLVAGATGSGKSVFLRSLLLSLMTQYPVGKLELLIVDPKQTDFSFFDGLPYLRSGKVFTQHDEAQAALLELVRGEMPRRQQLMKGRSLNIKEFNRRFPEQAMAPIVALIDEYAQLMSILNKKDAESFERDLMSLAAVSRSAGIHLVLATQRPSADVVTSTLKANLDARIAFRVASSTNSRVVLDSPGAENLLGRGDLLFRRPSGEILRLQAPFMNEEQMQAYLATLVL
jgi:hypothetical protein